MADMPTLGRVRRRSGVPLPLVIGAALLLIFVLVWWRVRAKRHEPSPRLPDRPSATAPSSAPPVPAPAGAAPAAAATATIAGRDGGTAPAAAAPLSASDAALAKAGVKRLRVEVNGPLETAVVHQVGPAVGQPLVQVVVRSLVWWLAVPGDLRRGDQLEALYQERDGEEPLVLAVRYKGGKANQLYRAYRFKSEESQWPRFFTPDGEELERRLVHAPLDQYEQVTSLLRDGRGHKGVDFKAPIGSPVRAPFDGTVVKKNWNFRGNGNSLEIKESDGHGWRALFLHLQEPPAIAVGAHVGRGDVIAKSGNTGHSFAPHLHYQLMLGEKVLDPFTVQETQRKRLPAGDQETFRAEVARLDGLLDLP